MTRPRVTLRQVCKGCVQLHEQTSLQVASPYSSRPIASSWPKRGTAAWPSVVEGAVVDVTYDSSSLLSSSSCSWALIDAIREPGICGMYACLLAYVSAVLFVNEKGAQSRRERREGASLTAREPSWLRLRAVSKVRLMSHG